MPNLLKFEKYLSSSRLNAYRKHLSNVGVDSSTLDAKLEELYIWNIHLSSAFLELFNYYEVALRNAILQTVQHVHIYSILDSRFIRSLPEKARQDLINTINQVSGTNYRSGDRIDTDVVNVHNVVAQLNFHFWEFLLAERFEERYWNRYFAMSFKNALSNKAVRQIFKITREIRTLRNRVCHNEPIFKHRNLWRLYLKSIVVFKLIDCDLATYVDEHSERLKTLIQTKPV